MISPSIAFLVMSDPQLELTVSMLMFVLTLEFGRDLAVTVFCWSRVWVGNCTTIWRLEPEPTSWPRRSAASPHRENAFSTSFGVIEVPVTVIWYWVPPLNSTPMLKPRVTKLITLIRMITADA